MNQQLSRKDLQATIFAYRVFRNSTIVLLINVASALKNKLHSRSSFSQFIALDIQYIEDIDIFVSAYFCRFDFVLKLKILIEEKQLRFIFEQSFNNNIFCEKFILDNMQ